MMILNKLLRLRKDRAATGAGWLAVFASALAFCLLLLDSVSGSETPPISRGAAVQGGPPPSLTLMFTAEVMGWTEPCG